MMLKCFYILIWIGVFKLSFCHRRMGLGNESVLGKKYLVYFVKSPYSKADDNAWICAGSIVTPTQILTAAACLVEMQKIYVIAGYKKYVHGEDIDKDNCTKNWKKKVIKISVPKEYNIAVTAKQPEWVSVDIGVAIVQEPYNFSDQSYRIYCSYEPQSIIINFEKVNQFEKTQAMAVGWGGRQVLGPKESTKELFLQEATTTVIEKRICSNLVSNNESKELVDKYLLCASGNGLIVEDGLETTLDPILDDCPTGRRFDLNNATETGCIDDNFDFRRKNINVNKTGNHSSHLNATSRRSLAVETCQNDHGGPLISWIGTQEIMLGIALNGIAKPNFDCAGPRIYVSTAETENIIKCLLELNSTRRKICNDQIKDIRYQVSDIAIKWPEDLQFNLSSLLTEQKISSYLRQGNEEQPLHVRPTKDLGNFDEQGNPQQFAKPGEQPYDQMGQQRANPYYQMQNPQMDQGQGPSNAQFRDQPQGQPQQMDLQNQPQVDSYNQPQMGSYNQPQLDGYNQPLMDPQNQPQVDAYNQPPMASYNQPQMESYNQPQMDQQNQPQSDPYGQPQSFNQPQMESYNQPQGDPYGQPPVESYNPQPMDSYNQPQLDTFNQPQMETQNQPQIDLRNQPQEQMYNKPQINQPAFKPPQDSFNQPQIKPLESPPVDSYNQPQLEAQKPPQVDSYNQQQMDSFKPAQVDSYNQPQMDSFKQAQSDLFSNQPQKDPFKQPQVEAFKKTEIGTFKASQPKIEPFSQTQDSFKDPKSSFNIPHIETFKPPAASETYNPLSIISENQPDEGDSFKLPIDEPFKPSPVEPYKQPNPDTFNMQQPFKPAPVEPYEQPHLRQVDQPHQRIQPFDLQRVQPFEQKHTQPLEQPHVQPFAQSNKQASSPTTDTSQSRHVLRDRQQPEASQPEPDLSHGDTQTFEQMYSQLHAGGESPLFDRAPATEQTFEELYKNLHDGTFDVPHDAEFEARIEQPFDLKTFDQQPFEQPTFDQPTFNQPTFDHQPFDINKRLEQSITEQQHDRSPKMMSNMPQATEKQRDEVKVRPQMPLDYPEYVSYNKRRGNT